MSALVSRQLTEREAALVAEVANGIPVDVSAERAGYANVSSAYIALRRSHVLAALHSEIQRNLVADAPNSFRVLRQIRDDTAAPGRVRADVSIQLVKLAGHVQPTNRDALPDKQPGEMTREEMRNYIDRNKAELERLEDDLAKSAKDVSAQRGDQDQAGTPPKTLQFLD